MTILSCGQVLSSFGPPGTPCKICGYNLGGSHYHCARCGRVGSYQGCYGSKDGKTWEFSCKPEDVEKWNRVSLLKDYDIDYEVTVNVRDMVDVLSGLPETAVFDIVQLLLDGEDTLIYQVRNYTQDIIDRWEKQDNA